VRRVLFASLLIVGIGVGCAPAPTRPPHLVAAWPAPGATVKSAANVELTFNRPLALESTWAEVVRVEDGEAVGGQATFDTTRQYRLRLNFENPLLPGDYAVRWHATDARSRASGDDAFAFAVRPGNRIAPRLEIRREAIRNEEPLELSGQGFAAGAQVQLTIGDENLPLETVQADPRGAFAISPRVPATVAFGVQPVSATDADGNHAIDSVKVRWGGWPPVLAWISGLPGERPGELTFALTLRNRSDYLLEELRVVVPDPDRATFVATDSDARHADGQVVWQIAWLDRGLAGPLHVTYRAEQPTASRATISFRHRRPRGCQDDECLSAFVSETIAESTPIQPAL
jgi:methionine-rich copper-binding protein CopC